MANLKQVVYLTQADYAALLNDTHDPKQYTKNGKTIYFDPNTLYITESTVSMSELNGVLPVNKGGTGVSTLASGYALIGNGTSPVTTRGIRNNTSAGALGWTSNTVDNTLVTTNTLAYWNGAYTGTTSNISKLGTITNGTWQATVIGAAYGGTGQNTLNKSANALINALDTGSSDLTANDYVITQYVGGGTTTTTYHRRPANKVINATLVKAALGTDSSTTGQWLNKTGNWSTPTAANVGAVTKLSSSTDNAIVRFDGANGAIQNSGVTIDDSNNTTVPGALRITSTSNAKYILMGNQDSGGANKPAVIWSGNGNLYFGTGDSWSSATGGTITTNVLFDQSGKVSIGSGASSLSQLLNVSGGSIFVTKAGECGLEVANTQSTNPNSVAFIVGSSGNGGIYSRKHTKWVVYSDSSGNIVLNGNANTASAVALSGVTGADDLKAIEALSGTSGFLKKTAANTWTLDTNTYLTSSTGVTSIAGKTGTVTLADLGLSQALRFIGITSTGLSDGDTTSTLAEKSNGSLIKTTGFVTGDVVIDTNSAYEYVWTGSAWERLGGDSSYKTTQTAISDPTASGNTTSFIDTISQNTNGVITATKKTIPAASDNTAGIMKLGASGGAATYGHTHTLSIADGGSSDTNQKTLAASAKYKLTAGGSTYVFTTPPNTTYANGTGITIGSGNAINHSNSVTAKTSYGSTATTASANGGTIKVTDIQYDAQGHITASTDRTITLSQTTYSGDRGISLVSGKLGHSNTAITAQTTQAIYPIKIDAYGHITGYGNAVTPVTGVKGNSESSYRTGQVNLTAANIGAIAKNETGNTQQLARPAALNGVNDVTYQTLINDVRANRLAFLPADQIIIEKTIDGGTTWTDAGYTDGQKQNLFSEKRQAIVIPQINGEMNINCGLRVTVTGMKYNVPANTSETQKYNYWNSNYVVSTERYCQIKNMYFWVSSAYNSIKVKVERATGAASTNWAIAFDRDDYGMTGWSGNDIISFSQSNFGGGTNQTGNNWNWRFTFMTRGPGGSTTLDNRSLNSAQQISEIRGYGDTWWTKANEYMASDHLYNWDYYQNVAFPADILPKVNNTKNLGSSSYKWANVYATTLNGSLAASNLTGTIDNARLNTASTSAAGIVQLSSATDSTSTSLAATASAVKAAYDLAASKTSLTIGTTATTAAAGNHTHSYLANTNAGAADRPIYITGNAASATTYRMSGTNVTATTALAITNNLDTGNWYVNGTSGIYSQNDGVAYVEKYSDSWIHEIYGDYRTGQIAVRGKNNGTWQAWRKILDDTNWKTLIGATTTSGATKYLREDGTWQVPSYTTSLALTAITGTDDLRAIEALTGTSGFLKKTAANTWSLDTNTYLTSASTLDATKLSGTIPSGCYTNSRDPGYGQITPANNASTVTALTGNTTPVVATNYSEGVKFTGANKWIVLAGSNSSTAGSDEIKFAHHVPSSISNTGPTSAQTPGYNATFNIPVISVDEAGHVTGISTTTVKIPATDNTNNAATHTLATTTKYYVTGTTSATTSTAGDSFDTGVYVTANAGELSALKYSVHDTSSTPVEKVQLVWNSTDSTLDFVFA